MTIAAVSDAGPLIHLAEIESLELLTTFEQLYVPETVYAELERGGVPAGIDALDYQLVSADEERTHTDGLDPGEAAALAVAKEHDSVLLTDDLAARDAASAASYEVHGSIGVIVRAYSGGLIEKDEAANRMRLLQRETSLFVTDAVVERGIDLLDDG